MADTVDPNSFFSLSKVGVQPTQKPSGDNVFGAFEHHLNLPSGSTKDALDSAKSLIAQSKALVQQDQELDYKESKFDELEADDINDDLLRKDRARIRKEAHELYDLNKNLLMNLYTRLNSQVDPSDKMWAAVASMISALSNSLTGLNKMTKEFREETEHDTEKRILAGEISENDTQEYDMSPTQANKLIDAWTAESEEKIQQELKEMAERNEKTLIENHIKETEQKLLEQEKK